MQVLVTVTVAIVVWAGCGALRRLLLHWRVLDHPSERSSHSQPVPRGGGWAVLAGLLPAWLWLAHTEADPAFTGLGWIVAAALALALVSWRDDLRDVPVAARLAAQAVAVAIGLWILAPTTVFQGLLPAPLDALATGLLWLWFVNLYNFMDGIDAITATETMAIGLGVASLPLAVAVFAGTVVEAEGLVSAPGALASPGLFLAAAAGGFLLWNWPPARLFIGDVGSVPLGFLVGWLLLVLAQSGAWAAALILPAYYLGDSGLTLLRRLVQGEAIWRAHRSHFYQQAVIRGWSHGRSVGLITLCNGGLIGLAILSLRSPGVGLVGSAILVVMTLAILRGRPAGR